jgi:transcriptional regulator with XRE-family HTH domain
LTLEALAYESDLGSKGHLSDLEKGLAVPTIVTLQAIAERLGVEVLDLVTFPGDSPRHGVVDATRGMTTTQLKALLARRRPR